MFKLAMWLVVAAVSAKMLMAQGLTPSPQAQRLAGCHEHGSKAPAPVSYQCCQAGHDVALVKASVVLQPIAECSARVVVSLSVVVVESSVVNLPEISGGPPGISQLRI